MIGKVVARHLTSECNSTWWTGKSIFERLKWLLLLLGVSWLAVGCRGEDVVPPITDRTRLVVAKPSDPIVLDPALVTDLESLQITCNLFETLVKFSPISGAVEPSLATHWELSEDGLHLTFRLRPGVVFHDGSPLDASAVVSNYARQNQSDHPLRASGDHFFYWNDIWGSPSKIASIEALDPLSVRFVLTEPVAPLLQNFSLPFFALVSPKTLAGSREERLRSPAGTGPFQIGQWLSGERVVLQAWKRYWGETPAIEEVVFLTVPDSTARELRLRKGAVHLATALSPLGVEQLRGRGSVEVLEGASLAVSYLAFNHQHPALSEQRVREAIWHAVDRDALVRGLYYGLAERADGPLPPGVGNGLFGLPRAYDPEEGRRLMAEAGYSQQHPLRLTLWYMTVPRSYLPEPKATAEALARMLQEIHVECRLEPIDWGVYLDRVGRGEHDLALAGWIGDYADPDNFLSFIFGGFNVDTQAGGTNVLLYRREEVDQALLQARRERDPERRRELYVMIQEKIESEAAWLPLAFPKQILGVHPRLEGFRTDPTGLLFLGPVHWASEDQTP